MPADAPRLYAFLGPGDIVASHRSHMEGRTLAGETSLSFSQQLVALARARGAALLAEGSNSRADRIVDGEIELRQRASPAAGKGGARFHLGMIRAGLAMATSARRFRADVAIVDGGGTHWWTLWAMRAAGIRVLCSFHNVMWPQGFRPEGGKDRALRALDGRFFARGAAGFIGCSPECRHQAEELAGGSLDYEEWRGQFRAEGFTQDQRARPGRPLRLLFVGRAEVEKGVVDMPRLARLIEDRAPGAVRIDIAGDGGGLAAARAETDALGVSSIVTIHGRLERRQLLPLYAEADAIIVPTRGSFCEGMPLVCAEAVIAGKPIVTSRLSNALPILGRAIAEAEPEDLESFADAVLSLTDPATYARLSAACAPLSAQFLDPARSYPAAIDRLLARVLPGWQARDDYQAMFDDLNASRQL